MAESKEIALKEALKINLKENHLYHCLIAELYLEKDKNKYREHLIFALKLTKNKEDIFLIKKKLNSL